MQKTGKCDPYFMKNNNKENLDETEQTQRIEQPKTLMQLL